MKPLSLAIAASLAGNAVLLAVLFLHSPSVESAPGKAVAGAKSAAPSVRAKNDPTAGVDPALWKNVGDADLAAQVARLRAAGFPPSIVRAIISAQIYESFAAKRKALNPPGNPAEFWKNDPPADPKNRAALRELALQQTRMINDLLGPDSAPPGITNIYERRQYAGIPPEKIDAFSRVKRDYDEMRSEIYSSIANGGAILTLLPEDRAKIDLLDKEQRADIARLLSPQELEDYELRTSNTANSLRYQLGSFAPTEAEFRAIYQQQRAFDEKYRLTGIEQTSNQDFMRERAAAQKQLTEQIKASLSPDRAADYDRAIDYNYQAIDRVVNRLGLPQSAAVDTWAAQKDLQARAQAVQTNRTLTAEARNAELATLNTEATARLTTALGQRGFDVYKQNGGQWMQILQPRPANGPAAGGGGPTTTTIRVGP